MAVLSVMFLLLMIPSLLQFLHGAELKSFDARQQAIQEDRTGSGISLVEIDKGSLNSIEVRRLFGRYPWKREAYAYLLRFLDRARAKAAVFELCFDGGPDEDHPQSDAMLVETVNSIRLPVMTSLMGAKKSEVRLYESTQEREILFQFLNREWMSVNGPTVFDVRLYEAVQIPMVGLMRSRDRAFPIKDLVYDENGNVRRAVLFGRGQIRGIIPTLPVAPLLLDSPSGKPLQVDTFNDGSVQMGGHRFQLHQEPNPIIHWYGNELSETRPVYPHYPIVDLIKSELVWECQRPGAPSICTKVDFNGFKPIDPDLFRNRYVLIGYNSDWYDSYGHSTLYDRQNGGVKYPNLYIQANILDNLLHDDFVKRPGFRVPIPAFFREPRFMGHPLIPFEDFSGVTMLIVLLGVSTVVGVSLRFNSPWISLLIVLMWVVAYFGVTQVAYVQYNLWLDRIGPMTAVLVTFFGIYLYRYTQSEQRKEQLRLTFSKYISPHAMAYIEEHPDKIRLGSQRELTFLFCDIRAFTSFAEQNDPETVQTLLAEYFTRMNSIILHQYGGFINKLMGDGILAFWGFPLEGPDDAFMAVSAAMAMRDTMAAWRLDPKMPPIRIGIGINTGKAMIGSVGSVDFLDFTVIGDSVNTASRLERLTKRLDATIIISRATYDQVKDRIEARRLGSVRIRGKEELMEIYEPIAIRPAPPES